MPGLEEGTMTALPGWMELSAEGFSAADYEALPEDVCRRIEVVDGAIVVNPAPRRLHQIIARRLANLLEQSCGAGFAVATDVDLRLRDVPLLNRRPDIVIFDASVPDDAVLRPGHCLLVAEVMSPGSVTADQIDKPAEYAAARIEHYWRIEQDAEEALTVFRYRLDPATVSYAPASAHSGTMSVSDPFPVTIDLDQLR
jgi:Uma2 family endonuclease